jgi:hypothetical protein
LSLTVFFFLYVQHPLNIPRISQETPDFNYKGHPTFSEGVATFSLQTFQTRNLTRVRKRIPNEIALPSAAAGMKYPPFNTVISNQLLRPR